MVKSYAHQSRVEQRETFLRETDRQTDRQRDTEIDRDRERQRETETGAEKAIVEI